MRTRSVTVLSIATLLIALGVAACGSSSSPQSSTSAAPTTTAAITTTTTTVDDFTTAVWPDASGTQRFHDPLEAARAFATTYLEFTNPVIGAFQAGDSRSGEVPVTPADGTAVTTIILRQLGRDSTWWVLGAATDNIVLETPARDTKITSPVTLTGRSTAFEATVNVEIREDGSTTALATGIVMGGANGTMGPFSEAISFRKATQERGAIVMRTFSAKDGSVIEATVLRIGFMTATG